MPKKRGSEHITVDYIQRVMRYLSSRYYQDEVAQRLYKQGRAVLTKMGVTPKVPGVEAEYMPYLCMGCDCPTSGYIKSPGGTTKTPCCAQCYKSGKVGLASV